MVFQQPIDIALHIRELLNVAITDNNIYSAILYLLFLNNSQQNAILTQNSRLLEKVENLENLNKESLTHIKDLTEYKNKFE